MAVRPSHVGLTLEGRVRTEPAFLGTVMVADHVVRDTEQPWSSVSCGIHAVDASQGLRERLGRDVGRGVPPDSA